MPDTLSRIRRNVTAVREAEWGDDPHLAYHPEERCQADLDADALLTYRDECERQLQQWIVRTTKAEAHIDALTAAMQNGLTRATAKGTAIDVDEWGRELYVVDAAVLAILKRGHR